MELHKLIQGSPEWLAYRATHFNASDAPAMMGCSTYKTRTQLLHEMHTGMTPDVDAATQSRFDDGHRFEAMARPLAEDIIEDDLYPVVGSLQRLSASFDGLTMDRKVNFEHKSLNAELRECMSPELPIEALPLQYRVQMEQQLLVAGAERCLFMASKWKGDELIEERHAWYYPDLALRQQIIDGWVQFAQDLQSYVPVEVVAAPVGKSPETLPALHIEVTGMVTASNLAEFKQVALGAIRSVNRDLKTDQDFADSTKARKWCADIEAKAKAAKQHALGQTATIDELFRALDEISSEARDTRIELERIEKARNVTLKTEIVTAGQAKLALHITQCNERIGRALMPAIPADFATAIKGMSKFDNMRNAVDTELARAKIAANEVADRITLNLRTINEQEGFGHLFYDQAQLALRDTDYVAMVIKSRIAGHIAAEADRIAAETARIAEQERAKAQARADAEIAAATAKVQAEARAQAQVDAEAARASAEAIAKAQAEHPAVVAAVAQFDEDVRVMLAPKPAQVAPTGGGDITPTMRLGQISERLGFNVTADFLSSLGFEPYATEKAAKLYKARLFPLICRELVKHINHVCDLQAA